VERRGERAAEILWAAVAAEPRAVRLGTRLIDNVLANRVPTARGSSKSRRSMRPDYAPHEATRAFWLARGLIHLDVIDPLPDWPPGNPAAIPAAALARTR
jgi:hypothetical protein